MRVQVNLASRPFVELRPFFLRLRLIMAALAVAGVLIAVSAHLLSARAEKQQVELDRLRNQTISVQQAKLHTEQRMRDPANARVLDRAHFLNTLFLRKSFSWTAVMMDLENVLPNGVQVTSIEPQIAPDGTVGIRLRVAGERANAVQLVRNLEHSHRFLQPRLASEASQAKQNTNASGAPLAAPTAPGVPTAPPGVEFDILAEYNPLPPGEPYAVGHGRKAVAPVSRSSSSSSPARVTPSAVRSGANVRRGYPADGVQLKPYHGPVTTQPAAQAPGPTSGGPL